MVIQGVIRPPPEIRAVADRTALYVAKNGRAFERKILSSEKGKTPKFAFLHDTSPFHAYYVERVDFYENGGTDEKEEKIKDQEKEKEAKENQEKKSKLEEERRKEKAKKASVIDPVAKALLTQRSKILQLRKEQEKLIAVANDESKDENRPKPAVTIPPPPPLNFVNIVAPAALSVAQIETIQLVAQFTALDGKGGSFLSQLTLREWNNPAFAFCQPRHGHFAYFSALVDAYRSILTSWTTTDSTAASDGIKEIANNTDKCLELAAYRAEYERDQEEQASNRDDALNTAAQIDWHQFVVVETIDFPPDEVVEISMLPPPPPPIEKKKEVPVEEEEMEESEEEEEQIRVVPTYQPKVVSTHEQHKLETVTDPITGKSIAVKDMPEHMRIQLLDPKWAEERRKFQEKQKESNLVSGDVFASNLERLAQARGDFGKKQNVMGKESRSQEALGASSQSTTVGPSLPGAAAPTRKRTAMALPQPGSMPISAVEPDSKRVKVEVQQPPPPPPPPPPPAAQVAAPPPPEVPFAAATTGTVAPPPTAATTVSQDELIPEAAFAASLDKPEVTLQIRVPNDPAQMAWNFYGQIVSLTIDVKSKVKAAKEEIARVHLNGMPVNKIQLKNTATGSFMKDASTLAALNIGPTATLELVPRARGGRKS